MGKGGRHWGSLARGCCTRRRSGQGGGRPRLKGEGCGRGRRRSGGRGGADDGRGAHRRCLCRVCWGGAPRPGGRRVGGWDRPRPVGDGPPRHPRHAGLWWSHDERCLPQLRGGHGSGGVG
ncbi:hypothetical protein BU14_0287s0002 [Porphyra umbilicalis]|uniref:Uncharacterized protein n=1 Tax=Porphyra umbilicalis TaxID=2786 RepID=A0A1X6P1I0_PORUM|nr:hypothetical protein BU14_0287s0002 [Porphyra umbilicalis]|eukprot:OSX74483.1 hypothetical protein BU14_0287s0002 [Porphyra umbilicalis]